MKPNRVTKDGRTYAAGFVPWLHLHWKENALLLSAFILSTVIMISISGVIRSDPIDGKAEFKRIPLTGKTLDSWMTDTDLICTARDKKKVNIPVKSLPEYLEWLRNNPEVFASFPETIDASNYIGITYGIVTARKHYKIELEHEILCDEISRMVKDNPSVADRIQIPAAPDWSHWDQSNLDAYKKKEYKFDKMLTKLIPEHAPLIPAWEEEPPPPLDPVETDTEANPAERKRISWKVVSRSRYGPRTIRKKPGTSISFSRSPSLKERLKEEE